MGHKAHGARHAEKDTICKNREPTSYLHSARELRGYSPHDINKKYALAQTPRCHVMQE